MGLGGAGSLYMGAPPVLVWANQIGRKSATPPSARTSPPAIRRRSTAAPNRGEPTETRCTNPSRRNRLAPTAVSLSLVARSNVRFLPVFTQVYTIFGTDERTGGHDAVADRRRKVVDVGLALEHPDSPRMARPSSSSDSSGVCSSCQSCTRCSSCCRSERTRAGTRRATSAPPSRRYTPAGTLRSSVSGTAGSAAGPAGSRPPVRSAALTAMKSRGLLMQSAARILPSR